MKKKSRNLSESSNRHGDPVVPTLERIFESLSRGDSTEIKTAKKELDRYRYKRARGAGLSRLLRTQMSCIRDAVSPVNRSALLYGLTCFGFDIARSSFDEVAECVLRELEHQSGSVREAARRLGIYLRYIAGLDGKKYAERYRGFLRSLAGLVKKYRPLNKVADGEVSHLESLAPSVYKSASLLWHEAIRRNFDEKWVSPEEERDLRAPVHNYEDPMWTDANELEPDLFAEEELWKRKKDGDPALAVSPLDALYQKSKARFSTTLARFGYGVRDIESFEREFEENGSEAGEAIMLRIVERALRKKIVDDLEELNGVMRDLQGFSNHFLFWNERGEPASDFLVNVAMAKEEWGRHKPENLVLFAELALAAHREIDSFAETLRAKRETETKELDERMRRFFEERGNETKSPREFREERRVACGKEIKLMREARSIAHHALDWYLQLEPWNGARKDAKKLAAVAWYVVRRYNEERSGLWTRLPFSNADLASFGGWKGAVPGTAEFAYYTVARGAIDENLLYLFSRDEEDESQELHDIRRELEERLLVFLKGRDTRMALSELKNFIFCERDSKEFNALIGLLGDAELSQDELNLISSAWNYFPHVSLDGRSPVELAAEKTGGIPPLKLGADRRDIGPGFRPRVGRNERCPCGSGKKYKKCCLLADERAAADSKLVWNEEHGRVDKEE